MNPQDAFVTLRYWAAARDATGTDADKVPGGPLTQVLEAAAGAHPDLARVLPVASVLVDGVVAHERDVDVPAGATVEILPPFAGG